MTQSSRLKLKYFNVAKDLDEQFRQIPALQLFLNTVLTELEEAVDKGIYLVGKTDAKDTVYCVAKDCNQTVELVWSHIVRELYKAGVEVSENQFAVLFIVKGCR